VSLDILETCLGQVPPPLTVIKNVNCEVALADDDICTTGPIPNPSNFTIVINGSNPSPNNFPGSSTGTDVELGVGPYNVTELGLQTPTPHACHKMGYDAGRAAPELGENLFICTNFSDGCEGDITAGTPETCTITNDIVFCEQEVRTLSNTIDPRFGFTSPAGVAYDDEHNIMYVANQVTPGTVSAINTNTDTAATDPIPVGNSPFGITVDEDTDRVYVANFGNSTVSVFDSNTFLAIDGNPLLPGVNPIPVASGPLNTAIDPDSNKLYVTSYNTNIVTVIDTNTFTVLTPITLPVGSDSWGIEYHPIDGTPFDDTMYITDFNNGNVFVYDTDDDTLTDTITLADGIGIGPTDITYDPDHQRMYVTNFGDDTVSVIDTTDNSVIDSPINVGGGTNPVYIAYDPICKDMYVTLQGSGSSTTVIVIDTDTNEVIGPITVGTTPIGIAYDPDHDRMYVGNAAGPTVSVIDLCGCPPVPSEPPVLNDEEISTVQQSIQQQSMNHHQQQQQQQPAQQSIQQQSMDQLQQLKQLQQNNIKSSSNSQQQNQNSIGSITSQNNNDQSTALSQQQMQQQQLEQLKQLLGAH
jgi:YVTN family beta-propeller protein